MGWIRDRLPASNHRSLDSLAKGLLAHPAWPKDIRIQARSLGTLLGKLDRSEELEWLTNRPDVLKLLAEELKSPLRDLQHALPEPTRAPNLWTWSDAPRAASLDLAREPLPPGIPSEVRTFGLAPSPDRSHLFWKAPSGAGRTLAGRWLETNGRCRFVCASCDSMENHSGDVRAQEAVFIEVEQANQPSLERLALFLSKLSKGSPVLLAAPLELPLLGLRESALESFQAVTVAPLTVESQASVVSWLLPRLPLNTPLTQRRVVEWALRVFKDYEWSTFGDLLSLLGTLDEIGLSAFDTMYGASPSLRLDRLMETLLSHRLVRLAHDPSRAWFDNQAPSALRAMAHELFAHGPSSLEKRHTLEDFARLLPLELQRTIDLGWLKRALPWADTHIRPSDVDRAAARLSPGAFHFVVSLERMGLLRDDGSHTLRLEPCWMRRYLFDYALWLHTGSGSPALGQALLGEDAPRVVRSLTRSKTGTYLEPEGRESLTDDVAEHDPTALAVFELEVRFNGLALLSGRDIEQGELDEFFGETMEVIAPGVGNLWAPAVDYPLHQIKQEPLLSKGFFYLSLLAMSEGAVPSLGRTPVFDPWKARTEAPPQAASEVLDAVALCLDLAEARQDPRDSAWLENARILLHRLGETRAYKGLIDHPAFASLRLFERALAKKATWEDVRSVNTSASTVRALLAVSQERRVWPELREALFASYAEAGYPLDMALLDPANEAADLFWHNLPLPTLAKLIELDRPVPLTRVWHEWPEVLKLINYKLPPRLASQLPEEIVSDILKRQVLPDAETLRLFWHDHPSALVAHARQVQEQGRLGSLLELLVTAPPRELANSLLSLELEAVSLMALPAERLTPLLRASYAASTGRSEAALYALRFCYQLRRLLPAPGAHA